MRYLMLAWCLGVVIRRPIQDGRPRWYAKQTIFLDDKAHTPPGGYIEHSALKPYRSRNQRQGFITLLFSDFFSLRTKQRVLVFKRIREMYENEISIHLLGYKWLNLKLFPFLFLFLPQSSSTFFSYLLFDSFSNSQNLSLFFPFALSLSLLLSPHHVSHPTNDACAKVLKVFWLH